MKCYYHPTDDAVGICARCGKALCSVCAEDVGGALLCPGCITLTQEEEKLRTEQEAQEAETETRLVVKSVKKTILWSWVVAAIFGCISISIWQTGEMGGASVLSKIATCVGIIYLGWSWYWGFIFISSRWGANIEKVTSGEHGWVWWLILLFFVVPYVGFLGGGIYQYLKCRKIIRQGD